MSEKTAKAIRKGTADYLLSVKDNQQALKEELECYVKDDPLHITMDTHTTCEKQSSKIEKRTAYTTNDVAWIFGKEDWENLTCIGAVHTEFTSKTGTTNEWHYDISSKT